MSCRSVPRGLLAKRDLLFSASTHISGAARPANTRIRWGACSSRTGRGVLTGRVGTAALPGAVRAPSRGKVKAGTKWKETGETTEAVVGTRKLTTTLDRKSV